MLWLTFAKHNFYKTKLAIRNSQPNITARNSWIPGFSCAWNFAMSGNMLRYFMNVPIIDCTHGNSKKNVEGFFWGEAFIHCVLDGNKVYKLRIYYFRLQCLECKFISSHIMSAVIKQMWVYWYSRFYTCVKVTYINETFINHKNSRHLRQLAINSIEIINWNIWRIVCRLFTRLRGLKNCASTKVSITYHHKFECLSTEKWIEK